MSIEGHLEWAAKYQKSAEFLTLKNDLDFDLMMLCGPVLHMVGLTVELTLKALLRGDGVSIAELKKVRHNTYRAYQKASGLFSEAEFLQLVASNTSHLEVPKEVSERFRDAEDYDPNDRWRIFFDHLRILDETYDRPYRSRYITPGLITLPEPLILLAGTKILQSAMRERSDLPPLLGANQ